jgi:Lrp/AsnC family leucine-responsive transcriptional regulator
MKLDRKDATILNLLQKNCRMPITKIAREVSLSPDSVKKRMDKMLKGDIYHPQIQLRPRNFGFSNIVDIKIKVAFESQKELDDFINYLRSHPRVPEIFSIAGEYDFSIVVISRDAIDLGDVVKEIRNRFGKMITDWNVSLTMKCHKFEKYDMLEIFDS